MPTYGTQVWNTFIEIAIMNSLVVLVVLVGVVAAVPQVIKPVLKAARVAPAYPFSAAAYPYAAPTYPYATPYAKPYAAPAYPYGAPAYPYAVPYAKPYTPYAAPTPYNPQYVTPQVAIVRQSQDDNFDGSFTSEFETQNGIASQSSGFLKNAGTPDEAQVIQGQFSYTAPDGTPIATRYYADESGFHADGAHLPTAPADPYRIA